MKRRSAVKAMALTSFSTPFIFSQGFTGIRRLFSKSSPAYQSNWENWPDLHWIGPEYWGNRLQDWEIQDGKAVCVVSGPNRALHILTHQLQDGKQGFEQSITLQWKNEALKGNPKSYLGFRIGAKGKFADYRSAAVFGQGIDLGISGSGQLVIGEMSSETKLDLSRPIHLRLQAKWTDSSYAFTLSGSNDSGFASSVQLQSDGINAEDLSGNLAIVAHAPKDDQNELPLAAFSDWKFSGEKITADTKQIFGPIVFAQYTVHRKVLKLTAQLAPVEKVQGLMVQLQLHEDGKWATVATSDIDPEGRYAHFRVENWDKKEKVPYRVLLDFPLKNGNQEFFFAGEIAKQPNSTENLKVAVFSCNADYGFPDQEVSDHVNLHKPDIALFLGDQFYESTGGFGIQTSPVEKAYLDYLHKWYMFGWSYREIFRNIPAAIIPDDHDVYHGNVWGEGGEHAPTDEGWGYVAQDQGGYKMPAQWVNMIQRTQTCHLPDAYDPTPVKQGIGVYYTDWVYGGVSFAILEDRKFKTAPKNVLPEEAKVTNGFIQNQDFDIKKYYDIEADLLGKRQMDFLENWVQDWDADIQMKSVLSQTNFCTIATLPEGSIIDSIVPRLPIPRFGEYVTGDAPTTDMDSNGWPQKGRDEAVRLIRKSFALHIAGDQHLPSTVQYGVDEFGDSGFAFAGPALNNLFPRRWWPKVPEGHQPIPGKTPNTGNYHDGFGNKMTIHAVGNPYQTGVLPALIHDRSTGYGIITFDKTKKAIKIECWPRYVNPVKNPEGQFADWPIQITEADNYGRKATAYLDTFKFEGVDAPLVSVFNEATGELEYNLRASGSSFQPKVFSTAPHRLEVKNLKTGEVKSFPGLKPGEEKSREIIVNFG
ncbi:alkaline phosphatase D family protein [Algoriphagus aestuariicola]|uniref:Alkaline phosphatase D family protein n=1 Tax=Algoriphagus aestuariicola TaxID=1852016 RepID=A0ABS3BWX6_9BACT|nr:alkaline phosphatase D family protein [Algoriphagus aestuariicola]MBN7802214.1 alkaline phosphatase D family protein [Algoriphagus aestuariicola]